MSGDDLTEACIKLEEEQGILKGKVKAFIKADEDYVMGKIDTDTYDKAFDKLKTIL